MADNSYSIVVTLTGGVGRRSSDKIDPKSSGTAGEYDVQFGDVDDLKDWIWLATLAPTDATPQAPGFITVEQSAMSNTMLHVRTWNNQATATNRAFHLNVRKIR